ncbi:hypothetical protein Hdeb2414_s0004g00132551 [Helianthus debilis subsp. tardiflorus]
MSSWVCRPLLLHKTLAPLHPFSSAHRPPPPLPLPPLHLRRPTPADTHLQRTPTLLHHSNFSPLLLHHSSCRRRLHNPSPPSRSPSAITSVEISTAATPPQQVFDTLESFPRHKTCSQEFQSDCSLF